MQGCVGGLDDLAAAAEHLLRGVAATFPPFFHQASFAGEVGAVGVHVAMGGAVVLVDATGADQPEVGPGDERSCAGPDLVLRFDLDVGDDVQHAQHRLPGGLAPSVQQGQDRSQHPDTATASSTRLDEVGRRAVAQMEGRVGQRYEVEHVQVSRTGQQRLGRRGQPDPVDLLRRTGAGQPEHRESLSLRMPLTFVHGGEHGVRHRLRQPPAAYGCGREVGEDRGLGQDQAPAPQLLGEVWIWAARMHSPGDRRPTARPDPAPYDVLHVGRMETNDRFVPVRPPRPVDNSPRPRNR